MLSIKPITIWIKPITIWEGNGVKRTIESVQGMASFLAGAWPGDRSATTYRDALEACLAALEGRGTASQARAAISKAAKAAKIFWRHDPLFKGH